MSVQYKHLFTVRERVAPQSSCKIRLDYSYGIDDKNL